MKSFLIFGTLAVGLFMLVMAIWQATEGNWGWVFGDVLISALNFFNTIQAVKMAP